MTACGVQPVATLMHQCEHFSLDGAVEPTPGAPCLLERPSLTSRACPCWVDGFAAAFPESMQIVVLDKGAGHTATAVRGPANVGPVLLPPASPARKPRERLWRDRQDQRADIPAQAITELSDALGTIIHNSSHATLPSLTSVAYFVQAVEMARQACDGSLPIRTHIIGSY